MFHQSFEERWAKQRRKSGREGEAICDIMVAYFYHAVTYELFGKSNSFVDILSATMLFALNYNQPFLTGFWNIEDILFFGLVFAYSYSVKKSFIIGIFALGSSIMVVYLITIW